MSAPSNLTFPYEASRVLPQATVVLLGDSGALENIRTQLSERGFQAVFVSEARYLAGAAALYKVIGVVGSRPAAESLGGLVRVMVDAGVYARLVAFVDFDSMHLLLGRSIACTDHSRGLQVISAALRGLGAG